MDEIPFHQKPWFKSLVLTIFLAGIYVYELVWQGGFWVNILGIALDLILLILLLQRILLCPIYFTNTHANRP